MDVAVVFSYFKSECAAQAYRWWDTVTICVFLCGTTKKNTNHKEKHKIDFLCCSQVWVSFHQVLCFHPQLKNHNLLIP